MRRLNTKTIEDAIKQFQMDKEIYLHCSDWDLAQYIIDYIKDKNPKDLVI